jgi:hypothetical protein
MLLLVNIYTVYILHQAEDWKRPIETSADLRMGISCTQRRIISWAQWA